MVIEEVLAAGIIAAAAAACVWLFAKGPKKQSKPAPVEANPKEADAFGRQGSLKLRSRDYKGAIRDFDRAIELSPENAVAYGTRGFAKLKLGDNIGAIRDWDKAISINPKYAVAYCNRGLAKIKSGDKRGTLADLEAAKRLGLNEADDGIELLKTG